MRVTKGIYKISTTNGWIEEKGSYAIKFPFIVHRKDGEHLWKLSHLATGYNIVKVGKLKAARLLVEKLEEYPIFLMPCLETWEYAKERLRVQKPEKYTKLLAIIRTGL